MDQLVSPGQKYTEKTEIILLNNVVETLNDPPVPSVLKGSRIWPEKLDFG